MVSRSTIHFSRWTCPQVLRIISPVPSTYTSTDGSDRLSFFNPSNSFGPFFMSGVETLTFNIDLVVEDIGTNERQSFEVEIVPDLKISFSSPPKPTTLPA